MWKKERECGEIIETDPIRCQCRCRCTVARAHTHTPPSGLYSQCSFSLHVPVIVNTNTQSKQHKTNKCLLSSRALLWVDAGVHPASTDHPRAEALCQSIQHIWYCVVVVVVVLNDGGALRINTYWHASTDASTPNHASTRNDTPRPSLRHYALCGISYHYVPIVCVLVLVCG